MSQQSTDGKRLKMTHLRAYQNPGYGSIDIHAKAVDEVTGDSYVGKLTWEREDNPHDFSPPSLRIQERGDEDAVLIKLANDLWDAGYRPTHARDVGDIVSAKDDHIKSLASILDRVLPGAVRKPE